jgi:hypothetical protein
LHCIALLNWGNALQAGMLRVLFPRRSWIFFNFLILTAILWLWGSLRNHPRGKMAAGA